MDEQTAAEDFRDQRITASLKRGIEGARMIPETNFRDQRITASLKRAFVSRALNECYDFRDQRITASLKRDLRLIDRAAEDPAFP